VAITGYYITVNFILKSQSILLSSKSRPQQATWAWKGKQ